METVTLSASWIWVVILALLIAIVGGWIGSRGRTAGRGAGRQDNVPASYASEFYRVHTNEILRLAGAKFSIGAGDQCGLSEITHAESLLLLRIVAQLDSTFVPDDVLFREIADEATRRHRRDQELEKAQHSRWMSLAKTLLKKINPIVTKVVGKWLGGGDD